MSDFPLAASGVRVFQGRLDMSDSDRIEMGRRGIRLVEERVTWPKVAAQMHELFQQILAK